MGNKKVDRRIVRTRKVLKDAFISLIQEKEVEAISVTDIVNRSEVNRSTFYAHFQDKEDLINCLIDELIMELIDSFEISHLSLIKPEKDFPIQAIEEMFAFVFENADYFKSLLYTTKVPQFTPELYANLYKYAVAKINELQEADYELGIHVGFYANYLASTFISFVHYWLFDKEQKYTPTYIANEYIKVLISNPLASYVRQRTMAK
ncbi:TetR/AcrR family transcriptional regulator [Sporosarcina sp. 179-K 3D1 HS]|uniref:TetR/AcrR family transcriptional regulator n=1 Tax=Sporosarcina sp. 179-K 3D1 HS TaxID=3232169 RepID=UPI0039A20854